MSASNGILVNQLIASFCQEIELISLSEIYILLEFLPHLS